MIVRDMVSLYYLEANVKAGAKKVKVKSAYTGSIWLTADETYPLGTGANRENIEVKTASKDNNEIELKSGLLHDHTTDDGIEFPADGWGGNPIIVIESNATEEYIKWIMGHEMGHAVLRLTDVNAQETIMYYGVPFTDHRLRYKTVEFHYEAGSESQWATIPR